MLHNQQITFSSSFFFWILATSTYREQMKADYDVITEKDQTALHGNITNFTKG
jgi:hypothetical protein